MGANDKFIIHYSEGTGLNLGKAQNRTAGWGAFKKQFRKPTRTKERQHVYMKLANDEQQRLKSIDGWLYRTQVEKGKRNAKSGQPSDLVTLDFDYATPDFLFMLQQGLVCPQIEWMVHSSRRHTEEKPRLRMFIPLARPITNEEYSIVARIVARMFDPEMSMVDKVSFRKAQMMFKPTASIDAEYIYEENEGDLLDPDEVLAEFERTDGDWRDITNWPRVAEEELRQVADKAENPLEKRGLVGDFCRAFYPIQTAMDVWIPGTYEPVDDSSEKPRFTYAGGTTSSGAVVEDDGLFLYSHHGSDPVADMLVNAFDLVRIHKFGHLDEEEPKDTPVNKLPSYKALAEAAQEHPEYKRAQAQAKYDMLAMFDDVADEYVEEAAEDEEVDDVLESLVGDAPKTGSGAALAADRPKGHGRKKKPTPSAEWFPDELELDQNGNIVQNLPNAQVIIYHDARLWQAIAYDDFMQKIVLKRDIKSHTALIPPCLCRDKVRGDIWQDINDTTVRAILASPNGEGRVGYGIDKLAERDLASAILLTALNNRFHPIKDYLWTCEEIGWDGKPRVEKLFIDYLGCPDTPYHRQTAKMIMVASVARIFEPGHKFDFSPVLEGEGGIRKSTFIEFLYGSENFGELTCDLRDTQKIAETIGGVWSLEFPEMTSFHKSDYNDAKQFLSAKTDQVRMAYDRRVSVFPRQATFWGTTNNTKYLKDPTGNRRWWPIHVNVQQIDTNRLRDQRDQLWAEAMAIYKEMRRAQPEDDLPLYLSDPEAQAEAVELQTGARQRQMYEQWVEDIRDWLDAPITLRQLWDEYGIERFPDPNAEFDPEKVRVQRIVVRDSDILHHVLREEGAIKNQQTLQNFDSAMGSIWEWVRLKKLTGKDRAYYFGKQGRWKVRADADATEVEIGYRLLPDDGQHALRKSDPADLV